MSQNSKPSRSISIWVFSITALIFGGLSIKSGGLVLFTTGEFHQQQGNYVPFVVWANFLGGFFYIIAAIGLFRLERWAGYIAYLIAIMTVIVYAWFAVHVMNGGLYEMQTVIAMAIRAALWVAISVLAYYKIMSRKV
ncbi:MAG: hypothetical protein GY820_16750 [Gammaproteobacteria bacterium]|nr:hypothetical protein [Gammaproteobacteria bacterium]